MYGQISVLTCNKLNEICSVASSLVGVPTIIDRQKVTLMLDSGATNNFVGLQMFQKWEQIYHKYETQ